MLSLEHIKAAVGDLIKQNPLPKGSTVITISDPSIDVFPTLSLGQPAKIGSLQVWRTAQTAVEWHLRVTNVEMINLVPEKFAERSYHKDPRAEGDASAIVHAMRSCIDTMIGAANSQVSDIDQLVATIMVTPFGNRNVNKYIGDHIAINVGVPDDVLPSGFSRIFSRSSGTKVGRVSYSLLTWRSLKRTEDTKFDSPELRK